MSVHWSSHTDHFSAPDRLDRRNQRKNLSGADEVIVTSSSNLCLRADRIDGLEVGYKDSRTYERLRRYLLDEFYAASASLHESGLSA